MANQKPSMFSKFESADSYGALDRITWFQARVLLEHMGVRRSNHPSGKKENVIAAIRDAAKYDPKKAQEAWDAVILKKTPPQTAATLDSDTLDRIVVQLADMVQNAQEEVSTAVKDELTEYAKTLLEGAADKYRKIEIVQQGKKPKKLQHTLPEEFDTMLQLATSRVNMLLVGPSGCGKTFLAERLAEALSLNYASQSCSEGVSESSFTGWLLPVGKTGAFEYVSSEFVRCYEEGGIFLADELDNSDANMLAFLNQAIAQDHFFIPQRFKNPRVNKHPDFVLVAAANTYGHGADAMYVGRNQLDAATLDRFRAGIITMDYSDKVESALVNPEVLKWGREVRKVIREHRLQRLMSTRLMLDLTKMAESAGWGTTEWNRTYFSDWSSQDLSIVKRQVSFSLDNNQQLTA